MSFAGALNVELGRHLPLYLQLFDGNETKFVMAIVRGNNGEQITAKL